MKDVANKCQSSDLLLGLSKTILLQSVCSVVPGSVFEMTDVELRDEEFAFHLAELVSVIDDKLSHVLDAGGNIDALLSYGMNPVSLFDCLSVNAVCVDGYNVTR